MWIFVFFLPSFYWNDFLFLIVISLFSCFDSYIICTYKCKLQIYFLGKYWGLVKKVHWCCILGKGLCFKFDGGCILVLVLLPYLCWVVDLQSNVWIFPKCFPFSDVSIKYGSGFIINKKVEHIPIEIVKHDLCVCISYGILLSIIMSFEQ